VVVAIAATGFRPDPIERPEAPGPKLEVVVTDPEPAPVAVVLLDDVENLVTAAEPVPTRSAMDRSRPAIAAVAPRANTAVTPEPETTDGEQRTPHSMFRMRDPVRDTAGAVFSFRIAPRDDLEHPPGGERPVEDVPESGRLQPSGGGTHRSNEGVFTARVERDGSVSLKDSRNLRITWPDPRKLPKIPKAIGNGIAGWYAQDDKRPKDAEREPINNSRPVDQDTRPDHGQTSTVPILGGGFDITDAFMRRKKVDPYASKKLAYLDSTRDERVQIGKRYRKSQLAQSAELMQKQLDVVWASHATIHAKKQALYELWEDCAETGDAAVVEGGRAARRLVIGFINAKLPMGSANAFTTDELASFNQRRRAKAAFEPYR
jgi:hypothetical protein